MPPSSILPTNAVPAATLLLTSWYILTYCWSRISKRRPEDIRRKLPKDIRTWRRPGDLVEADEQIWNELEEVFFRERGYIMWRHRQDSIIMSPNGSYPMASGFRYTSEVRGVADGPHMLRFFAYTNPQTRIFRTPEGYDVSVRVVVVGKEGHSHLRILRKVATGPHTLQVNNHSIPMLSEFHFEDIIFGVFPLAGCTMATVYGRWAKNSVGDIMDMILQALEGLVYLHSMRIAHRDMFSDNLLVQWHPESLTSGAVSVSRPRVYIIDFEFAVDFPPHCPVEDCVCTGFPIAMKRYGRIPAPELMLECPYDPFKLDVWQLAATWKFKTTVDSINQLFYDMGQWNPSARIDSREALVRLRKFIHSMPQDAFCIEPDGGPAPELNSASNSWEDEK